MLNQRTLETIQHRQETLFPEPLALHEQGTGEVSRKNHFSLTSRKIS